jgi:acetyl-CoA carboxylase biotin carboxyl carrier protein
VPLTAQDVAEITRLLEESDFDELHLEQDGLKLTLKRNVAAGGQAEVSATGAVPPRVLAPASGVANRHREPHGKPPAYATDPSVVEVTAPLVGIFYRAPRPGAPPYVEVGAEVQEDTIIGIIEVMKLMNAVRAEVQGTVVEILVQDGAAVEYAQVLLRVSRGAHGG